MAFKSWFRTRKKNADRVCGMTDIGLRRSNNEDAYLLMTDRGLYVVADGMGGHNAGEVASAEAVKMLDEYFTRDRIELMKSDEEKIKEHFRDSFGEAHRHVNRMSRENPEFSGMGCALIMAFVTKGKLHTYHVGDVRCYVCNPAGILKLTNDHTHVADLVRAGQMTEEEARKSHLRNLLTQSMGISGPIAPEYNTHVLLENERVLLCSDGLWDMVSDKEIHEILTTRQDVATCCKDLVILANASGGKDNITVVVIEA